MTRLCWILATLAPLAAAGCDCGSGGDDDDDDGGACPSSNAEHGTVEVTVDAPPGAPVAVVVTGSDGTDHLVDGPTSVTVPMGPVTVTSHRTRSSGPIVGTVYIATPDATELCMTADAEVPLHVVVTADPASNKLWVAAGDVLSIASGDLDADGAPTPAAVLSGSFTNPASIAFGPDGNLWVTDANHVAAYANADLGANDAVQPAIVLTGASIDDGGVPGAVALAFDRNDALWVANLAGDRVMRFDPADIAATGEPVAAVTVSGPSIDNPQTIAFDRTGNLWLSSDLGIVMFRAARLTADVTDAADLELAGLTPEPVVGPLGPASSLAFDAAGNLWGAHFAANVIAGYSTRNLEEGGEVTPVIQVRVPVDILLDDIVIDEADGIWLTGAAGQIGRLAPAQLQRAGDATPDVILSPVGMASASGLAFYPGASATPLPY